MSHQGIANGNGTKLTVYRIFIATLGVFATMFSGLVLFSIDARIDQRVQQKLAGYVDIQRYEREQRQHSDWSDDKVSQINKRFDDIEASMGGRTLLFNQMVENQNAMLRDLRLLKERTTKTP